MINSYPQLSFVFDRRKIATTTQKAAVEIRITYNRKQKYLSTGILLYANQWKKGNIVNCPDVLQISQTLDKIITDVRQIILDMINEGNININTIADRIKRNHAKNISFINYCKERAEVRKYGITKGSQLRYDRFIKFFSEWGKIKYFEDITDANVIAYDVYLKKKNLKRSSVWNNYHRFLNSFILDAIDDGLLIRNPYQWINIDKRRIDSINKCLTPEEFRKLKTIPLPTKKLERARDVFVFQTYTCLSYADLLKFDARNIQEIKGTKVYMENRQKTDVQFTTPILSPAWDIIMKYEGKLPIINNSKYNEYLKLIAQVAGIDKPISSHWARHTGATLLLNEGVDAQIIKKICGHSSVKITEQIYAKLLDETVVDAVKDIDDKF